MILGLAPVTSQCPTGSHQSCCRTVSGTSCQAHVFEVMDLQDLLAAIPAAEGLCPGQGVNLHHNLLLLAVAEERVLHVIDLGGQSHTGVSSAPLWCHRLSSGCTGWCWGTRLWAWVLPPSPALSQSSHQDSTRRGSSQAGAWAG